MISNDDFKAIAELDLEPLKVKLMHKESGEGWTREHADAVEFEYRRFLTLMKKYPNEPTAPGEDVDTFWHYHILDTMKYAVDCEAVFGYFLHHFPYVGLRGDDDAAALERMGERMKQLYAETFGEALDRGASGNDAAFCGVATEAAFCGVATKPAFCGVATKPAFCGVATKPAFCGVATKPAFCGVATKPAFCGVATKPAFCGVATKPAFCGVATKSAFCGVATQVAFCGVATQAAESNATVQDQQQAVSSFYTERPRLTQAAQ
ncbi:glycine-rich domain-containing protein [Pseudoduganella namucuonensis]|uniref:Glycine-rich domain-containing protein-like n=1 Tax=Pseudoduganella namucuonensis TaxID=1035707 RepID=A0A1I7I8Y0_9BURK|nr:hypothetical protein [Pseudoduganella namucuonensis]SFU69388.1 hypothetical protein SAMN05216552_1007195 [Pseudoduganella namucuonensis]